MIALQYNDLFDLNKLSTSTNTDALPKGGAFTFIKVFNNNTVIGYCTWPYSDEIYHDFEMFAVNRLCKQ